jgi:hypothetical protein
MWHVGSIKLKAVDQITVVVCVKNAFAIDLD